MSVILTSILGVLWLLALMTVACSQFNGIRQSLPDEVSILSGETGIKKFSWHDVSFEGLGAAIGSLSRFPTCPKCFHGFTIKSPPWLP